MRLAVVVCLLVLGGAIADESCGCTASRGGSGAPLHSQPSPVAAREKLFEEATRHARKTAEVLIPGGKVQYGTSKPVLVADQEG